MRRDFSLELNRDTTSAKMDLGFGSNLDPSQFHHLHSSNPPALSFRWLRLWSGGVLPLWRIYIGAQLSMMTVLGAAQSSTTTTRGWRRLCGARTCCGLWDLIENDTGDGDKVEGYVNDGGSNMEGGKALGCVKNGDGG